MTQHTDFMPREDQPDLLSDMIAQKSFMQLQSQSPLLKLRKNLAAGIWYGAAVSLLYILLLWLYPVWQIQAGLAVCLLFTIWLMYRSKQIIQVVDSYDAGGNVLATLRTVRNDFRLWFRQQYRLALLVFPVAAAAGFMLGGIISARYNLSSFIHKPGTINALIISICVLAPVGLLVTHLVNRRTFGRYITQLDGLILQLEEDAAAH